MKARGRSRPARRVALTATLWLIVLSGGGLLAALSMAPEAMADRLPRIRDVVALVRICFPIAVYVALARLMLALQGTRNLAVALAHAGGAIGYLAGLFFIVEAMGRPTPLGPRPLDAQASVVIGIMLFASITATLGMFAGYTAAVAIQILGLLLRLGRYLVSLTRRPAIDPVRHACRCRAR
jgi:hypothetical protein